MRISHLIALVALLPVLAGLWWWSRTRPATRPDARPPTPEVAAKPRESVPVLERSALADGLNAPAGSIQQDIQIVATILEHWATNFPAQGNPVGTNAEITRALAGANRLQLSLIPPDHPAINRDGELVDRWGTPFRFHQWSSSVTEIISAGPDRDFATGDDVSSQ